MNSQFNKSFNVLQEYVDDSTLQDAQEKIVKNDNKESISMKVLSIIGGFLSTLAFLAFMFIAQVFNSGQGMLVFGIVCIAVSYFIHYKKENLVFETVSVTLYMAGYILFTVGLLELKLNESLLCCILIVMSLISIFTIKSNIILILSVLLLNGAFITLYNIHDVAQMIYIHLSVVTVITFLLYFYESFFISQTKIILQIYQPIRIGFSLIFLFSWVGIQLFNHIISPVYIYILSLTILFFNLYLLYKILCKVSMKHQWQRFVILFVVVLLLAPTYMFHGIAASLLLMLLCFYTQYSIGVVISAIMLVYYLSRFYYDLQYTLLLKSIILMISGLLFFTFYFITKKYLATHEEN